MKVGNIKWDFKIISISSLMLKNYGWLKRSKLCHPIRSKLCHSGRTNCAS